MACSGPLDSSPPSKCHDTVCVCMCVSPSVLSGEVLMDEAHHLGMLFLFVVLAIRDTQSCKVNQPYTWSSDYCDDMDTSTMCTLLFTGWPEGHEKTCETGYIGQYWNSIESFGNGNEWCLKETSVCICSSLSQQLLCWKYVSIKVLSPKLWRSKISWNLIHFLSMSFGKIVPVVSSVTGID